MPGLGGSWPASWATSASARAFSGVSEADFSTTELLAAMAGATFQEAISSGAADLGRHGEEISMGIYRKLHVAGRRGAIPAVHPRITIVVLTVDRASRRVSRPRTCSASDSTTGRNGCAMDWTFFWAWMAFFFVFIPLMMLWIYTMIDIFRRPDIGGLAKFLWLLLILFLPLLGMLIYFIARPDVFEEVA